MKRVSSKKNFERSSPKNVQETLIYSRFHKPSQGSIAKLPTKTAGMGLKRKRCSAESRNASHMMSASKVKRAARGEGNKLTMAASSAKVAGTSKKIKGAQNLQCLSAFLKFLQTMRALCALKSVLETFNIQMEFTKKPTRPFALCEQDWSVLMEALDHLSSSLHKLQCILDSERRAGCNQSYRSKETISDTGATHDASDSEVEGDHSDVHSVSSPLVSARSHARECSPPLVSPFQTPAEGSVVSPDASQGSPHHPVVLETNSCYTSAHTAPDRADSSQLDNTSLSLNKVVRDVDETAPELDREPETDAGCGQGESRATATDTSSPEGERRAGGAVKVRRRPRRRQVSEVASDDADDPDADDVGAEDGTLRHFPCTSGCTDRGGAVRQFASEKSLRMHLAAAHGQRAGPAHPEYNCPLCSAVQKRPSELAQHLANSHAAARPPAADTAAHDAADLVVCRLCHLCFPQHRLLRQHRCCYAPAAGVIQELVGSGALTASGLQLARLRRFVCYQCEEEFRGTDMLRVHLRFCTPPPYTCHLCGEVCRSGPQRALHLTSQHRGDGALFPCPAPDCGLQFQRRASFQKHLRRRHGGRGPAPPFSCDSCDKKFIRKIYLTHHRMRYHHETLQRDFVCDVCGARLGTSSALQVHLRSVHQRPEHSCSVCGKVFARRDALLKHARIHTGERKFRCSVCPMAFFQHCKLNEHLRRHRGERRFRCVVCDKLYAASGSLRDHLRRVHQLDMPNRSHTIQPVRQLLRPLPEAEAAATDRRSEPEPPDREPPPEPCPPPPEQQQPQQQLQQEQQLQQPQQSISLPLQQTLQSVQLQPVQVAAPAAGLHVQQVAPLGRSLLLIPAVDASGGTTFYPILNQ